VIWTAPRHSRDKGWGLIRAMADNCMGVLVGELRAHTDPEPGIGSDLDSRSGVALRARQATTGLAGSGLER
jgi:hypothetical protein